MRAHGSLLMHDFGTFTASSQDDSNLVERSSMDKTGAWLASLATVRWVMAAEPALITPSANGRLANVLLVNTELAEIMEVARDPQTA